MGDEAFDPARLEAADFDVVRRGFDPTEVRAQLQRAADEYRRLRVERDELAGRLAEFDGIEASQLEASRVAAALGAEAAGVLESAHQAATERAERAEREAEAVRENALAEADAVRATAQAEADEILERARQAAEELVDDGRSRGRDMVAEAQTVRERMLSDLARKRQTGRAQVEQLRAARDRLLDSLSAVQDNVDHAVADLVESVPEARSAAERAGLRVAAEPEITTDQLEAEIEAARHVGHPLVDDGPDPGADETFDTGEMMALTDLDDTLPGDTTRTEARTEPVERVEPPTVEPDGDDEPEPAADGADTDEVALSGDAASGDAASGDAASGDAASGDAASDGADGTDTGSTDTESGTSESADTESGTTDTDTDHDTDLDVVDEGGDDATGTDATTTDGVELYDAESESDSAAEAIDDEPGADEPGGDESDTTDSAEPDADGDDDASGVDVLFARLRESHGDEPGGDRPDADEPPAAAEPAADEPEATEATEDPRVAIRADAVAAAVRALKKVLVDEQGTLLDGIRRSGGDAVHELIEDVAAHESPYDTAARPTLVALAGGMGADAVDLDPALAQIHAIALEPVRQRLAEVADSTDDPDELSDTVRALYRESRSRRLPEAAAAAVVATDGLAIRATAGGPVRWVVDPDGPCGPDCADNALAGEVGPGDAFPTGDLQPPSHAACTCRLEPAD